MQANLRDHEKENKTAGNPDSVISFQLKGKKLIAGKKAGKILLAAMVCLAVVAMFRASFTTREARIQVEKVLDAPGNNWVAEAGIAISSREQLGRTRITVEQKAVEIDRRPSIRKVVGIHPEFDEDLDAEMVFTYNDDDLNGLAEEALVLYSSADDGRTWTPHPNSVADPASNSIRLGGIGHFSLWTAAESGQLEETVLTPVTAGFVVTTNANAGAGSLRQAILDVNALGAGPHTITFAPALSGTTITLASDLPVLSVPDVTIDGDIDDDGIGDITIDANGGDITRWIFRGNANADNAHFIGFTLQDTGYEPFRFDGSPTGVTIENMVWRHTQNNWQNYGIYFVGNAVDLTIRNVVMTQKQNIGGGAIYITGTATNVLIDNFDLSNSGGGDLRGIQIDGAANNVTIRNCDLDLDLAGSGDDGNYGILFQSTATNILIDSLTMHDAEVYGIRFYGVATNITITNSTFDNFDGYTGNQMIRFESTVNGLVMTDVSINEDETDNGSSKDDGNIGIVFIGAINADVSKSAILTRVSVHAADDDGIYVNTTTNNLTLNDCSITGKNEGAGYEDGIEFYNNVVRNNVVITNSTFDHNGRAGIIINAANGTSNFSITNNTITNNSRSGNGYGIWLWTGNGNKAVTISGNTIANNLAEGIRNVGPDAINITRNSIYNNGSLGINNDGNSGNNDFEYNEGDAPFILSSVPLGGDDYTVTFTLPSFCTNCDVEFFTNDPGDKLFNGRNYVHTETGLGAGSHSATVNSGGNNTGFWTATLKSNTHGGSVSEFSFQAAINPVGPGCVTAGIRLWLRADDVSPGNILTGGGWSDFSGNANHFTLGGSDPNRIDGGLNFNNYVNFDANDHLYAPTFTNLFTSGEVFSVLQARSATGGHAYNFGGQSNNHYRSVDTYESFGTNDRKGWRNSNNTVLDGSGVVVTPSPLFDPTKWNLYNVSADGVANTWAAFFNGFKKVNDASNVVDFSDTYNRIGHGDASYFDGNTSEIVLYDRALTAVERQRVNSYMALKYGLTLDQTNPTNYLAGDGTVIWPAGGGYDNDIAGIGRDDCQALNQKQSASISSDAFVAMGLGAIAANNAANPNSFSADKHFLMWGNNDAPLTLQFEELPAAANPGNQRLMREWKVKETGSVANLVVRAGTSGFSIPTGASNVELYIDTDGDGDFTTGAPTVVAASDFTDGVATFNGVDLNQNNVFTFGWFQIAPGCVGGGLKVWLKGNAGITQATGVSVWADQSGSANDVIQATASRQPAYNSNAINFNPAPQFDGSNDILRNAAIDGGSTTGTNSREIIVVTAGLTNSGSRTIWNYGNHPGQRSLQFWNYNSTLFRTRTNVSPEANRYYTKASGNDVGIMSLRNDNGANISAFVLRQNGVDLATSSTNTVTPSLNSTELQLGVHEANNTALDSYYKGPIAEFILYEDPLTPTDRQKVETYLAIKYGVTLASDYLAGDGSVIRGLGSGYDNDIAGIGRDDCQALNQKQSRSVNDDAIITMGLGAIAADNAANANTFGTDRSYLLWGNNNGDLAADAAALPADNAVPTLTTPFLQGLDAWMERKWKVTEKNSVGAVKVRVDYTNFSTVYLVTASDAAFSTGVTYTAMTLAGDSWEADYDFSDGQFFTIAGVKSSPGCVLAGLSLWLKANSGVTASGASATVWEDLSDNGIKYTDEAVASRRPELVNDGLNFNPVLRYDGSAKFLRQNTINSIQNLIIVSKVSEEAADYRGPFSNYGADNHRVIIHAGASRQSWRVGGYFDDANDFGDGDPFYLNGASGTTLGNSIHGFQPNILTIERDAVSSVARSIGHVSGGRYFHGDIAEIVGYSTNQGTNERERIESYLALKYGITLGHDYLAGDGTTKIWDLTANATYSNDIAGIGYEACQALNQKQSKSVGDDALVTMGLGTIAATNKLNTSSFGGLTSFMIWGNNDGALDVDAAALPGAPPSGVNNWMERKWLVKETGTVGSVRVRFDFYRFSNVYLVTANDAGFTSGVTYTPMTQAGSSWETDFDFADGQYFTIAGKVTAPGGVAASLELWVKADVGTSSVSDSTAISTWKDVSSNALTMAVTAANRNPFYRGAKPTTNFNPIVNFDGSNDGLELAPFMTGAEPGGSVFGAAANNSPGTGYDNLVVFGIDNPHLGTAVTTGKPLGYMNGSSPIRADHPTIPVPGQFHIWGWEWDMANEPSNTSSNTGLDVIFDGEVYSEPTMEIRESSFANGAPSAKEFQIGSYEAVEPWDGPVGEVAVYSRNLTPAESQKVNSYFSLRWGTTLDNNPASPTVNFDYVDSDGNVLWAGTGNANVQAFHHDVAGIGRDDASGLAQKQSRSANAGEILTVGLGTIAAGNPSNPNSFTADQSFLLWGNNDGGLDADMASLPAGAPANVNNWLERKWLAQEKGSGTVGSVTVRFAFTGFSNLYLVTASDAAFTSGVTYTPMSDLGEEGWETAYDFADGEYFTIAGYALAPGCVVNGLLLWSKADSDVGVEDGEPVEIWENLVNPD
ncbi:MAG TPA: right-handed parallel beta-helix repeat-containing protein, partial [Flavilitoribacter sp.]|nr:right-handed parallel beta-helix repeat-containing protein [Flavilitoribacter sp.]